MKKQIVICRLLISFGCIVFLLTSCDDSTSGPAKPTVVRKKVLSQEPKRSAVAANRPSSASQPALPVHSPAAPEIKPVQTATPPQVRTLSPTVSEAATDATPPASKAQPKPMLAKTDTRNSAAAEAAPPPKSDISPLPRRPPVAPDPGSDNAVAKEEMVASVDSGMPLYSPAGKVDPFEPLYKDKPSQSETIKKKRKIREPRTPLERIDISQLQLVGIILAASGNRALVEESSGKGYVIQKGTYIGTNAGKVTAIEKDMVIVEEEYEDVFGKLKVQKKELKLPKPAGEL